MPDSSCVDVLVWDHSGSGGKAGGHAAMLVDRQFAQNESETFYSGAGKTYVSWWPHYSNEGRDKTGKTGGFHMQRGAKHSMLSDLMGEMREETKRHLESGFRAKGGKTQSFLPSTNQKSLYSSTRRQFLPQKIPTSGGGYNPLLESDALRQQFEESLFTDGMHTRWVRFPNKSISIPLQSKRKIGLNADAMLTFWETFRCSHKEKFDRTGYKFISKRHNCASVVMRTLIAGEAGFFVKPPKSWVYFSPADVVGYALKLQKEVLHANQEWQHYYGQKLSWQAKKRTLMRVPELQNDLPKKEQWVDMSNANVKWGLFKRGSRNAIRHARRGGESVAIDRLLDEYHAAPSWEEFLGRVKREGIMFEMWKQTASYLARKPNGDRKEAMLLLAQMIMKVRAIVAQEKPLKLNWFDIQRD